MIVISAGRLFLPSLKKFGSALAPHAAKFALNTGKDLLDGTTRFGHTLRKRSREAVSDIEDAYNDHKRRRLYDQAEIVPVHQEGSGILSKSQALHQRHLYGSYLPYPLIPRMKDLSLLEKEEPPVTRRKNQKKKPRCEKKNRKPKKKKEEDLFD